jgi:hypothetical protein
MRYAVATDRAERNPVADLRGALIPPPEKNHAAVVDPVQLGGLLRALHAYHGPPVVQAALSRRRWCSLPRRAAAGGMAGDRS